MRIVVSLVLLTASFVSMAAPGKVYRCVDAKGTSSYGAEEIKGQVCREMKGLPSDTPRGTISSLPEGSNPDAPGTLAPEPTSAEVMLAPVPDPSRPKFAPIDAPVTTPPLSEDE